MSEIDYSKLDKRSKEYKQYKKGLGDLVEDITKATGIKKLVGECEGCNKRKETLNIAGHQLEYFFKKHSPNEFKQEDKDLWNLFTDRENQNKITTEHQLLIVRLLKDVLNMSVKPCSNCDAGIWKKYIQMINTVYDK